MSRYSPFSSSPTFVQVRRVDHLKDVLFAVLVFQGDEIGGVIVLFLRGGGHFGLGHGVLLFSRAAHRRFFLVLV